jgi:hypothetical protein
MERCFERKSSYTEIPICFVISFAFFSFVGMEFALGSFFFSTYFLMYGFKLLAGD